MNNILSCLEGVRTVIIAGHTRPDGDCVGSCMGMYLYLKENYPQIQTDVYLEEVPEVFHFIQDIDQAKQEWEEKEYDLFLEFDVSSTDRIGVAGQAVNTAKITACIDHHITNKGIAQENQIVPDASSTCKVLYELLEPEKINKACAEALYTGIVHDTGVFQYSCTGTRTMEIAGQLMAKGIDFTSIIKDSFYTKSYAQNQIMGRTIMESIMLLDQRCIVGYVRKKDMDFYGVEGKDLDGNPVKSDELFSRNAVTVVNFWFTTCSPCVGELGELDALNKELAEKNGALIGVNSFTLDGNEAEISEAKDVLAKKGATYQNVYFDSDSEAGRFTTGIYAYPTTYVVDRNGNIVGDPIVGAITEKNQAETLQKLIDQAIASDTGENEE